MGRFVHIGSGELALFISLMALAWMPDPLQAQMRISGTIDRGTRWYGRILITGDVTVAPGVTLSIDPGTRIEFLPLQDDQKGGSDPERSELIVLGNLLAVGDAGSRRIVFTSAGRQPRMRDWYGIILKNLNQQSQLNHCVVEYAYKGITCYGSAPLIENSEIRFNYYAGVSSEIRARPILRNCTFIGNDFAGINCELASTPLIEGCLITQNGNGVINFDRSQPDLGHYPASEGQSRGMNRISGNFDANVYNHASVDLYAQNNAWNSRNVTAIQATIIDRGDDPQFGRVVILPLWHQVQRRLARRKPRPVPEKTAADTFIAVAKPGRVETPLLGTDSAGKAFKLRTAQPSAGKPPAVSPPTITSKVPVKPMPHEIQDSSRVRSIRPLLGAEAESPRLKQPERSSPVQEKPVTETKPVPTPPPNVPVLEPFLDSGRREYVRRVAPLYPEIYKRTHHEGKVILEAIVGLDGRVESYRVLRSDGELFTRAAVQALRDFIYKPGKQNGRPVRFKVIEQFIFKLR